MSIRSFSRIGLTRPMRLVSRIATRTTATWPRYGRKNATIRRMRVAASLARDRRDVALAHQPGAGPAPWKCHDRAYQAVSVLASVMPCDSSQRSASIAAMQPSPAAVTAWR